MVDLYGEALVRDIVKDRNLYGKEEFVKFGNHYFVTNRGPYERITYIMKIEGLSEDLPQKIYGALFNLRTGDVRKAEPGDIFACQVQREVTKEELEDIKQIFIKRIQDF